jgi:nicotinamidase-related amidase
MGRTALVLIDVQRALVDGFEADWDGVLDNIVALLGRARAARISVVHVQHDGPAGHPLEVGSTGWRIHPTVAPIPGELVIHKRWSDAFAQTELADALDARGVRRLVISGAQTEYCVDATVRRAASLGYDVTLVADGHTTSASRQLSREQIVAHHNRTLPGLALVGTRIAVVATEALAFRPESP